MTITTGSSGFPMVYTGSNVSDTFDCTGSVTDSHGCFRRDRWRVVESLPSVPGWPRDMNSNPLESIGRYGMVWKIAGLLGFARRDLTVVFGV